MTKKKTKGAEQPWLKSYPANINWDQKFEAAKMSNLLDESAAEYGDNVYLDFMGKEYTYRDMKEMADKCAKSFQEQGLGKGSRIALCLPNSPFYVAAYYGALKAGATVVNINPLYSQGEMEHLIKDSGADMMITMGLQAMLPKAQKLLKTTNLKKVVTCDMKDILPFPKNILFRLFKRKDIAHGTRDAQNMNFRDLLQNDGKPKPVEIDPENDVAVLQYTGGTTGLPKGASLTHKNLWVNTEQCRLWFDGVEKGKETMVAALPFFHVFAMTAIMNLSTKIGARMLLVPKPEVNEMLDMISKKKPTIMAGVPTLYKGLSTNKKPKHDLSSVKFGISGGAALSGEIRKEFEGLTGCKLVEGYGLSESSPVATVNPLNGTGKDGSIGLPVPGTKIEIRMDEAPFSLVKQGEKGEINIVGPQLMKGYHENQEATDDVIKTSSANDNDANDDGISAEFNERRLRTGDIGYMDEDGYTFIVDRKKDVIIAGGYNVFPRMVEEQILLHPDVEECIVGAKPDEYRGETVKAWVVTKPGKELDSDSLLAFLKDRLNRIEIPRDIEFRDELPKTMIGKPDRKVLVNEEKEKYEQRKQQDAENKTSAPKQRKKRAGFSLKR